MDTRMPRSSVARATRAGGRMARLGKSSLLSAGASAATRGAASLRMESRLFRSVMAIIGKLVESVNTGNKARK